MKKKCNTIIIAVLGVAAVCLLLYPAMTRIREEHPKATCKNNLKNIGLMMKMYAQDYPYQGEIPSINDLLDAAIVEKGSGIFICPASGKQPSATVDIDKLTDYVILPVADVSISNNVVAGFCKYHLREHGNTNILYVDGHIGRGFIDEKEESP